MIQSLHISNYALIDSINIYFNSGLNIITGETGAGKSIMLGALGLILGERADLQAIGDSSKKSIIEAVFKVDDTAYLKEWFTANDFDWDQENLINLRREIAGTRSRAFINDTPVTLDKLQWLATRLVDIHSQHENALLSDPDFQLDVIDSLAANASIRHEYSVAYKEYKKALKDFHDTRKRIARNRTDEDFIRFQLAQLEDLDLQPGEKEELEHEREIISNVAEIKTSLSGALEALSSGETNIIELLDVVSTHLSEVEDLFDPEEHIDERLETVRIDLSDIAATITERYNSMHGDRNELDNIESRLRRIYDLEERHSTSSPDDLIDIKNNLKARLEELDGSEIVLADLEKKARKAKKALRDIAKQLTDSRMAKATWLEATLCNTARPLGMSNLQVSINIEPSEFSPTGADSIRFLFSFNKNQPLLPVKGAASGGEISRLMLTLKSIIAHSMSLPTIIFDEIDTGVSGDVANRMGNMMADIADTIQVIAITHLPQVAAKGESHFKVYKQDDQEATHTYIRSLSHDERVSEIALMLSGSTENAAARQTAQNLLSSYCK